MEIKVCYKKTHTRVLNSVPALTQSSRDRAKLLCRRLHFAGWINNISIFAHNKHHYRLCLFSVSCCLGPTRSPDRNRIIWTQRTRREAKAGTVLTGRLNGTARCYAGEGNGNPPTTHLQCNPPQHQFYLNMPPPAVPPPAASAPAAPLPATSFPQPPEPLLIHLRDILRWLRDVFSVLFFSVL